MRGVIRMGLQGFEQRRKSRGFRRLALGRNTAYSVAVPAFLSTGGDGYAVLKGRTYENTGLLLRDLVIETIRQRGVISGKKEGRIRRMQEESYHVPIRGWEAASLFPLQQEDWRSGDFRPCSEAVR